jgi:spore coat polysaccharide biosynthesis protein SpsF (cytidylyltransferase family)
MIAIIQARLNSKRLPGKVLKKIGDKTMLEHCIDRVKKLPVDKIIIAVSHGVKDWELFKIAGYNGVESFECWHIRENDLLKRFLMCGIAYNADYILRVPADCPFFDISAAEEMIKMSKSRWFYGVHDYIAHYLEGEDTPTVWQYAGYYLEVVRLSALFDVYNRLPQTEEKPISYVYGKMTIRDCFKEHPTSGIYLVPERYKIKRIMINEVPADLPINTQEDLNKVRRLYDKGLIE